MRVALAPSAPIAIGAVPMSPPVWLATVRVADASPDGSVDETRAATGPRAQAGGGLGETLREQEGEDQQEVADLAC